MWHKSKYTKENIFFEKIKHYYIRVHPYTLSFLKDVNYNLVGDIHQVTHQDSAPSAVFEQILTFCTKHKSKKELIAFCSFKDLRNFTLKYKCNYYLSQKNLVSNQDCDQVSEQDKPQDILHAVLDFCITKKSKQEICSFIGYRNLTYFTRKYLNPLLASGQLKMTIPDKPNSRKQKYITVHTK